MPGEVPYYMLKEPFIKDAKILTDGGLSIYANLTIYHLTYHICAHFQALVNLREGSLAALSLRVGVGARDKKGWTQRLGLANVSPKGLYHGIRGWFKLDSGS